MRTLKELHERVKEMGNRAAEWRYLDPAAQAYIYYLCEIVDELRKRPKDE